MNKETLYNKLIHEMKLESSLTSDTVSVMAKYPETQTSDGLAALITAGVIHPSFIRKWMSAVRLRRECLDEATYYDYNYTRTPKKDAYGNWNPDNKFIPEFIRFTPFKNYANAKNWLQELQLIAMFAVKPHIDGDEFYNAVDEMGYSRTVIRYYLQGKYVKYGYYIQVKDNIYTFLINEGNGWYPPTIDFVQKAKVSYMAKLDKRNDKAKSQEDIERSEPQVHGEQQ